MSMPPTYKPSPLGHGPVRKSRYGNALSQLQPAQVRTMREAFQILDRDSDGAVNREDLTSAFSAFDDDDSGQIDVAELRDALLHTAPEPGQQPLTALDVEKVIAGFTGRRAFSKTAASAGLGKQRGEGAAAGGERDGQDGEDA
ncbi:hypothetical protein N0V88_005808 [Collariella sp. IMI 366227]|nr:hypothetical protein N0V88_005808 [Collariella sp. IMI 366227]